MKDNDTQKIFENYLSVGMQQMDEAGVLPGEAGQDVAPRVPGQAVVPPAEDEKKVNLQLAIDGFGQISQHLAQIFTTKGQAIVTTIRTKAGEADDTSMSALTPAMLVGLMKYLPQAMEENPSVQTQVTAAHGAFKPGSLNQ